MVKRAPLQIWAFQGLALRSWAQFLPDSIEWKSARFACFAIITRRQRRSVSLCHPAINQCYPVVSHRIHPWHRKLCGRWPSLAFCQTGLPPHSCSPASFWDHVLRALKVSLLSQQEHRQATSPYSGAFPWTRKSNLDYLALDFNSASPSPVQKVWVICKTPQPPIFLFAGRKTRPRVRLC